MRTRNGRSRTLPTNRSHGDGQVYCRATFAVAGLDRRGHGAAGAAVFIALAATGGHHRSTLAVLPGIREHIELPVFIRNGQILKPLRINPCLSSKGEEIIVVCVQTI